MGPSKQNAYRIFVPSAKEVDPVLTAMEQAALLSKLPVTLSNAVKNGYLCMMMTRYLQSLFHEEDLLEETGSKTLRMVRKLTENSDVQYSIGKPCDWRIWDCIFAVIELTMRLTPDDFGKLVCYLHHMFFFAMTMTARTLWHGV